MKETPDKPKTKGIRVDPRHAEHSFDFQFWRDNQKLWALEVPVEEIGVDELAWILDVPFWEDEQAARYSGLHNKKGEWLTLDGLHRFVKMVMEGKTVVNVRKIPPELIEKTARDGGVMK